MARRAVGLALLIVCIEQLVIGLDLTIVNVALPDIHHALSFTADGLAWVVDAYALTWGGLIVLGGRLADLAGRKATLVAGVLLFVAASALGGLARNQEMLISARLVQGAGAALASPAALALVTALVPPERIRKAVAIFSAAAGAGAAIGYIAGGVVTTEFGWRWVLLVNVPIGAALVIATWLAVPSVPRAARPHGLDLPGTALGTVGLLSLVYGVLRAGVDGWSTRPVLAALALAGLLLVAFAFRETTAAQPIVPRWLLASRTRVTSYVTGLLLFAWMVPALFVLTQWEQDIRGWSPLRIGVYWLPTGIGTVAGALIARRLSARLPAWTLVITGAAGLIYSSVWLSRLTVSSGYAGGLLPAFAVAGLAIGMALAANTSRAVEDTGQEAGTASGVLQTSQQLGASVAVAALAVVASTAASRYLHNWSAAHHTAADGPVLALATTHGYTVALSVTIGIAAVMIAAQALALGRIPQTVTAASEQRTPAGPRLATDIRPRQ